MRILPQSIWIAYSLTSPKTIESLLPRKLTIASSSLLKDDHEFTPKPKLLFNAYNVESPWMVGTRVDVLALARHIETKRLHLVILDCMSDVLRWNPSDGIQKANAHLKRRSPRAANLDEYKLCIQNSRDELSFRASILEERAIDWRFSVEANRVCFYKNCDRPFSMQFNESCIALPVRRLSPLMLRNTLWSNVRSDKPTHAFLHPHSMSFDVDVDFLTGREKV